MRGGRRHHEHHEPHYAMQSWFEWRELRRQDAAFADEGGGRLSVDGRGRDGLHPPWTRTFVFHISTARCAEHFVFWDGGEGEPTGIERQREQVPMSGPSELRQRGGHGEPQHEDGTRSPTTRTHTIVTRAAIVFFSFFFTRQ